MSDNSKSDTNVKIDITASADGMAPGVDKAKGDLDQIANATSEFEKKQRAAVDTSEKMAHVTGRTREQFAQLGKEVVNGDTGRMPGTLASIAMNLLPVSLGLGAIAATVAAGVWAWKEWGGSAEEEAAKVTAALKKANDEADKSKHKTTQEQIQDKQSRIAWLKDEIAWIDKVIAKYNEQARADPSRNREFADRIAEQAHLRGARRRDIENEIRNIEDLQKPGIDKAKAHQKEIDATIEREQSEYDRLHEMAVMADATDAERVTWKLAFDLQKMEEGHDAARDVYGRNREMEDAYQQARINKIAMAEAAITALKKKANDQRLKEGEAVARQDLATLGERYRAFFELSKAVAIGEIWMAGGARAEKSAAWAATWGGPVAAAVATGISWAATAVNIANVAAQNFGAGSVSGVGGVPSVSSPTMTPSIPVTTDSAPIAGNPVAAPIREQTIHIHGTIFDAQTVRDLLAQMSEQIADGVKLTVVTD